MLKLTLLALLLISTLQNPICTVCHAIVEAVQHGTPSSPTEQLLDQIGTIYCTKKHIEQHNVCKGAVNEMMHSIVNSLWRHYTDPHAVCHKLRFCPKEYIPRNLQNDIKRILQGKPTKQWEQPTLKKTIKIMHISDLHPDLFYTVGAPAQCSEPVCCRSNVTQSFGEILARSQAGEYLKANTVNESPAGYWGSIAKCDLPLQTFNLFLQDLSKMNIDMIIWTGDNTPHDIWQQSQSYNLNFTVLLTEKLRKHTNATIIAAMGNHESYPVNVYDYEGKREAMLIAGLAEAWRPFLDVSAYEMLRTKGYFSISLPKLNNLKVISVNTQAQNDQNWFLLRNPTDPGGMLAWIEKELKESEVAGQFVYIIGHISPTSAMNQWSMRFNALTQRYTYIIRGQFYGHTHSDHLGFFQSFANKAELSGYYLISPSLTTYSGKHPEYRVMTVDYDTLQVTNYDQYLLNVTKFTRKEQPARFELFYNFQQAYNVTDMTVRGGMTKVNSLIRNSPEAQILYTYYKSGGVQIGKPGKDVICDTATSPQLETECRGGTYSASQFEKIAGNWKDLKH